MRRDRREQHPIYDKDLNRFLLEDLDAHKPTKMVPTSIIRNFTHNEELIDIKSFLALEKKLFDLLGPPYYSDLGFILYCGDCCQLLSLMEDLNLSINLTITSPPYNIGKPYEKPKPIVEFIEWCSDWMRMIHKITCPSGSFWLNLGYFEVPDKGLCVPIPYLLWDKSPFYLLQEIVWNYKAGVATRNRLSPRNEKWLFYVMDRNRYTFNLDAIRDPNVKYPYQKKGGRYRCNPLGKNPSDVWEFPKVTTGEKRSSKERTSHPAQFPLQVIERIILCSSKPGDLVLDPFSGSCSTGLATVGLGRVFIGMEISPEYCKLAVDRFKTFCRINREFQKQKSLF